MIKKISLLVLISFMLVSCGKKNCPTYTCLLYTSDAADE